MTKTVKRITSVNRKQNLINRIKKLRGNFKIRMNYEKDEDYKRRVFEYECSRK